LGKPTQMSTNSAADPNGIDPLYCDSIVNKTPLAAETNRSIGGVAPI